MYRVSAILFTLYACLGLGSVSAGHGVERLLDLERIYVEKLESYVDKVQQAQTNINRFLDYVDVVHDDMEESEEYFGNPLNAFITISRLVNNWKHEVIDVVIDYTEAEQHHKQVDQELNKHELESPTSDDLLDVSSNVQEFQELNNLPTSELANDVLYVDKERNENVTLSASDCYELGRGLHQLQHYEFATEWLLEARSRLSHNADTFASVGQLQILEELAPALQQLRSYKLANKLNNEILKADPKHKAALKNKITLENKLILGRLGKLEL